MTGRYIIYPEIRYVREATLRQYLLDAIANGEIDDIDSENASLDEVCEALTDLGFCTFSKNQDAAQNREAAYFDTLEDPDRD